MCKISAGIFFVTSLLCLSIIEAKSTKKWKDESSILNKKLINKAKPTSSPVIIAIEIVDPNNNKTKNSKRTIDSSLGYGYNTYSPPRYQVYKYSQQDIPAFRGEPQFFSRGVNSHQYDILKSLSYKLPTQYYQPGTTLYSTVNSQGQAGGLSSHLPQHQYDGGEEPQVPVIILKVLPSQLNDPSAVLHSNLPQNHPLASTVNSINIQSLLNKYVQNIVAQQQHQPEQPQQQEPQHYQPQQQEPQLYQSQQQYQDDYQYQQKQPDNYQYQQNQPDNYQYQYQYEPSQAQPQPQYQYQEEQSQPQDYQYQYYEPQGQSYQEQPSQQQRDFAQDQNDGLLTHENYPKDTHTRVVFRTDKNHQESQHSPTETKTIQIQIPDHSYSSVQVQTPDMEYSYGNKEEVQADGNLYYYGGQGQEQQQSQNAYAYDDSQNYYNAQPVQDYGGQAKSEQPNEEPRPEVVPTPQPAPYNHHAHSKQNRKRRVNTPKDVEKLDPVKM